MSCLACIGAAAALAAMACTADARECLEATAPLAAGETADGSHFVRAACPAELLAAFRYDRAAGNVRATRPIAEGEVVAAFDGYDDDRVAAGQSVIVTLRAGPIVVERRAVALQAARKGQRLFVRDDSGEVFSVGYESLGR